MNDHEWYPPLYTIDEDIKEIEMIKKFKSYNIAKERVELYKDFTINLLYCIHDTYLGKEYINSDYDIRGHFTWCYRNILTQFEQEDVYFHENEELYDYFFGYYQDQFYKREKIEPLSHYEKFWENIFDIKKNGKKRNIFEVLWELYEIFDKTVNKRTEIEVLT